MTNSVLGRRSEEDAARVRVIAEHEAGNSFGDHRQFSVGEIVHVVPRSDRDLWWTSYDIDGAYAIPGEKVEVLGRSYHWDPLPGSYTWTHATDAEREFWTRARAEGRAIEAAEKGTRAQLQPIELQGIDRPEDYVNE